MRRSVGLLCLLVLASPVRAGAGIVATTEILGPLAGPGAPLAQPGLAFYGTDLGWTVEHDGKLLILFGDTWPYARFLCDTVPLNDDCQATLPLGPPAGPPTFFTRAGAPDELDPILVLRGAESLDMGFIRTPLAAFSDGADVIGVFGRPEYVPCTSRPAPRSPSCPPGKELVCAPTLGLCMPPAIGVSGVCDTAGGAGCLPGQTCTATAAGLCADPTSSQNDGTAASTAFTAAVTIEIARQDPVAPASYHEIATLATNKFLNSTVRTVERFGGRRKGNRYGRGTRALLWWGRPGFSTAQGRESQLYLLWHRLPFRGPADRVRFRPKYFAGANAKTGEPRWTRRQSKAAPLALDGVIGGSPHEVLPIVNQMAISWVGDPINRWVMLYGGDLADYLLVDPANARPGPAPGSIRIRFAAHPWGPWTPPVPVLAPGSPTTTGDPYGPGGVLFHPDCVDAGATPCARSDPSRPPDAFLPGCPELGRTFDAGRFYAPNVIDAYTRLDDAARRAQLVWNVSTWNPYAVVLVSTDLLLVIPDDP
jgi:hypothetical protein